MKKLYCHVGVRGVWTLGKVYDVIKETPDMYFINDDHGRESLFTKKPDADGLSFATWFSAIDDGETPATRWKVLEVLPNGTGGTLREERFYDAYELALNHVLQAAALYNQQYAVKPLKCTMRGDLMFSVRGKGEDEFEGSITLERTAE